VELVIRVISQRDLGKDGLLARLIMVFYRGSRTLCTIHYIDWNQKKTLNLSNHKDLPKRPIKPEVNTELSYLQKMLIKNDREFTPELLESFRPSKKIKKPVDSSEVTSDDLSKGEQKSPGEISAQDGIEEERD
jgi:hypothetical protein